jgi:hypothetical protein
MTKSMVKGKGNSKKHSPCWWLAGEAGRQERSKVSMVEQQAVGPGWRERAFEPSLRVLV